MQRREAFKPSSSFSGTKDCIDEKTGKEGLLIGNNLQNLNHIKSTIKLPTKQKNSDKSRRQVKSHIEFGNGNNAEERIDYSEQGCQLTAPSLVEINRVSGLENHPDKLHQHQPSALSNVERTLQREANDESRTKKSTSSLRRLKSSNYFTKDSAHPPPKELLPLSNSSSLSPQQRFFFDPNTQLQAGRRQDQKKNHKTLSFFNTKNIKTSPNNYTCSEQKKPSPFKKDNLGQHIQPALKLKSEEGKSSPHLLETICQSPQQTSWACLPVSLTTTNASLINEHTKQHASNKPQSLLFQSSRQNSQQISKISLSNSHNSHNTDAVNSLQQQQYNISSINAVTLSPQKSKLNINHNSAKSCMQSNSKDDGSTMCISTGLKSEVANSNNSVKKDPLSTDSPGVGFSEQLNRRVSPSRFKENNKLFGGKTNYQTSSATNSSNNTPNGVFTRDPQQSSSRKQLYTGISSNCSTATILLKDPNNSAKNAQKNTARNAFSTEIPSQASSSFCGSMHSSANPVIFKETPNHQLSNGKYSNSNGNSSTATPIISGGKRPLQLSDKKERTLADVRTSFSGDSNTIKYGNGNSSLTYQAENMAASPAQLAPQEPRQTHFELSKLFPLPAEQPQSQHQLLQKKNSFQSFNEEKQFSSLDETNKQIFLPKQNQKQQLQLQQQGQLPQKGIVFSIQGLNTVLDVNSPKTDAANAKGTNDKNNSTTEQSLSSDFNSSRVTGSNSAYNDKPINNAGYSRENLKQSNCKIIQEKSVNRVNITLKNSKKLSSSASNIELPIEIRTRGTSSRDNSSSPSMSGLCLSLLEDQQKGQYQQSSEILKSDNKTSINSQLSARKGILLKNSSSTKVPATAGDRNNNPSNSEAADTAHTFLGNMLQVSQNKHIDLEDPIVQKEVSSIVRNLLKMKNDYKSPIISNNVSSGSSNIGNSNSIASQAQHAKHKQFKQQHQLSEQQVSSQKQELSSLTNHHSASTAVLQRQNSHSNHNYNPGLLQVSNSNSSANNATSSSNNNNKHEILFDKQEIQ